MERLLRWAMKALDLNAEAVEKFKVPLGRCPAWFKLRAEMHNLLDRTDEP